MKNHISVRKNPYTYPSWVVSFAGINVGSAHSAVVAQAAARIAAHYALIINPSNLCPSYLIANVAHDMAAEGWECYWTAETITGGVGASKHQQLVRH